MTEPDSSWRDEMPRDDRIKVCQHIMGKLHSYYRNVPEAQLKARTSAFESQAFSKATSRRDYLEKIAEGLSKVEAEGRRGGAAPAQAQAVLQQQQQLQAQQQAEKADASRKNTAQSKKQPGISDAKKQASAVGTNSSSSAATNGGATAHGKVQDLSHAAAKQNASSSVELDQTTSLLHDLAISPHSHSGELIRPE